jgi:high-affinity Fe2+/Pb2+ permease
VDDTARHRLPWLLAGIVAGMLAAIVLGYALYVRLGRPKL